MLNVSEIGRAINRDAPERFRGVLTATLSMKEPGWVDPVIVLHIAGSDSYIGSAGRSETELAVEIASMFQDFVVHEQHGPWPVVTDGNGRFVAALDLLAEANGPVWHHGIIGTIPLGDLNETLRSRGLAVAAASPDH